MYPHKWIHKNTSWCAIIISTVGVGALFNDKLWCFHAAIRSGSEQTLMSRRQLWRLLCCCRLLYTKLDKPMRTWAWLWGAQITFTKKHTFPHQIALQHMTVCHSGFYGGLCVTVHALLFLESLNLLMRSNMYLRFCFRFKCNDKSQPAVYFLFVIFFLSF